MNELITFSPEAFMLLELNKFNDSKDFYESVKDDLKKLAIEPMRGLASYLSDELFSIDDKMNLVPTKIVSRIRRDTRFSKNKNLYRDNVWVMFMRDKHQWKYQPCMWFEIFPGCYSYGVGIFRSDARYLETFREIMLLNQQEFIDALRMSQLADVNIELEIYKKEKPGTDKIDESIRKFYNSKGFWITHYSNNVEPLYDGQIMEELTYAIRAFAPMYKFLLKVTDKIYEKGDYVE